MVQSVAIGNLTLPELEEKQHLKLADDPAFFTEWCKNLLALSDEEIH